MNTNDTAYNDFQYSVQDIMNCGGGTCVGGLTDKVLNYLIRYGATTENCISYKSGRRGQDGLPCSTSCDSGEDKKSYYVKDMYTVAGDTIRKYLMLEGPMVAELAIYEDFLAYGGGVYVHTVGQQLFSHAVIVVGFGHDSASGLDYWLCLNSWGPDFGEKGYFKIATGKYLNNVHGARPRYL